MGLHVTAAKLASTMQLLVCVSHTLVTGTGIGMAVQTAMCHRVTVMLDTNLHFVNSVHIQT
jgi:hypothetical protein